MELLKLRRFFCGSVYKSRKILKRTDRANYMLLRPNYRYGGIKHFEIGKFKLQLELKVLSWLC